MARIRRINSEGNPSQVEPVAIGGFGEIIEDLNKDIEEVSAKTVEGFSHVYEDLNDLEDCIKSTQDGVRKLGKDVESALRDHHNRMATAFERVHLDIHRINKRCTKNHILLGQIVGGDGIAESLNIPTGRDAILVTKIKWGTLTTYTLKKFNKFHKWILKTFLGVDITLTYIKGRVQDESSGT